MLHQEAALLRSDDGSYRMDWEALESAITLQTKLLIFCNPYNPVGKVYKRDELERLAEICLRKNLVICSDEIHCDLIYPGNHHIPIASLSSEVSDRTITLMSPSKTFNSPGLQCSFAVIQNRDLRKRYLKARKGLVPWVNGLGLAAAEAAYAEGQEWLDQALAYLEANRDFLYTYVNEKLPGIRMGLPEGTYLAWLDCQRAGIESNPYKFFLENARVGLVDGELFGEGGQGLATAAVTVAPLRTVKVVVGPVEPVLPDWAEDVELERVLEGLLLVLHPRRDVQDLPLPDGHLLVANQELQRALEDVGHLLALVRVHGDDGAALQVDVRDHLALSVISFREIISVTFRVRSRPSDRAEQRVNSCVIRLDWRGF